MKPKIAITLGDPAGIGPEIAARVCLDPQVLAACSPLVVGARRDLAAGAQCAGMELPAVELAETGEAAEIITGRPTAASGRQAGLCIERALELCQAGDAEAMATCPISKEALRAGGYPDTGHTTLLARLTQTPQPVMMLACPRLKVILITIHIALSQVPASLSTGAIVDRTRIAARDLARCFGLESPRLALAGLNPHAGEGGLFGDEEARIIAPATEILRRDGLDISDPLPPDTVFWRAAKGEFDLVVCMYHDQGLIPLKLLGFSESVNVTLGLPIIRTSVGHGTAYDLAGRGEADPASLKAAVLMAAQMARNARQAGSPNKAR